MLHELVLVGLQSNADSSLTMQIMTCINNIKAIYS